MACIVMTTPSTAATMPRPGSASATFASVAAGMSASRCRTSRSSYIRWSKSCGEMPPTMITRAESARKATDAVARGTSGTSRRAAVASDCPDAARVTSRQPTAPRGTADRAAPSRSVYSRSRWRTHQPRELPDEGAHHGHRRAGHENADRGAANDDELGGLKEQESRPPCQRYPPPTAAATTMRPAQTSMQRGADESDPILQSAWSGRFLERPGPPGRNRCAESSCGRPSGGLGIFSPGAVFSQPAWCEAVERG